MEESAPVYLPTFGYGEIVKALMDRRHNIPSKHSDAKASFYNLQQRKNKAAQPSSYVSPGSAKSAGSSAEVICGRPMWSDRILWRAEDGVTLEQVRQFRVYICICKP